MVEHHRVASAHIISVERLLGVDLVFLRSPSSQAEVDDIEPLVNRMRFLDAFNGFVVLADHVIDFCWVCKYLFELAHSSKLLLSLIALDGVSSLIFLLVRVCLHGGYNINKRISATAYLGTARLSNTDWGIVYRKSVGFLGFAKDGRRWSWSGSAYFRDFLAV